MESRNASFFEREFPCKSGSEPSSSKRTFEILEQEINHESELEVELRRSKRVKVEKSFGPNFITFMIDSEP